MPKKKLTLKHSIDAIFKGGQNFCPPLNMDFNFEKNIETPAFTLPYSTAASLVTLRMPINEATHPINITASIPNDTNSAMKRLPPKN